MATSTDTEQAVLKAIADMSQRMEVGFAQVDTKLAQLEARMDTKFAQVDTQLAQLEAKMDTKFAQMDTKLSDLRGEMNQKFAQLEGKVDTKLAKIEGDIALLRQPRDFADFVKRGAATGMIVTVVGGLLLAAGKLLIFGAM